MRRLLITSAMVLPLVAAPVLAQQAQPDGQVPPPPGTAAQPADQQAPVATDPATAPQPDAQVAEPVPGDDQDTDVAEPLPDGQQDTDVAEPLPGAEQDADVAEPMPGAEPDTDVADDPVAEPGQADTALSVDADAEAPAGVVSEQQQNELRGSWVIGTNVTSPEDERIGSIQDVIIDMESGQVTAAVLSVGGFLGFGAKNIAVDWNELQIDHDAREISLALTREDAEAAPEYAFRDRAEAPGAAMDAAPPAGGAPGGMPPPPAN
jgi:sporulation protein YlmC with PRC-barrel domain